MTQEFNPTLEISHYEEQLRRLLDTAHLPACPMDFSSSSLTLADREKLEQTMRKLY